LHFVGKALLHKKAKRFKEVRKRISIGYRYGEIARARNAVSARHLFRCAILTKGLANAHQLKRANGNNRNQKNPK